MAEQAFLETLECDIEQICKDKEEAEVWICGLEAVISGCQMRKLRSDGKIESTSDANSPIGWTRKTLQLSSPFGSSDSLHQDSGDACKVFSSLGVLVTEE